MTEHKIVLERAFQVKNTIKNPSRLDNDIVELFKDLFRDFPNFLLY
jgi:hypothetical protein